MTKNQLYAFSMVLIPLILGFLINNTYFYKAWFSTPVTFTALFAAFWFWLGIRFANLPGNKTFNFLAGNSLTIIFFILYVWAFFILEGQNSLLALISQYYILPITLFSSQIMAVLHTTAGREYTMLPYILLFLIFSAGFILKVIQNKKQQ